MTIRKPPRVQFDHASLDDAEAVAKTINRIQDAVLNTVDELVRRANEPAAAVPQALPAGVVLPYGGSTAPDGYLICNGQAVSRKTYSALFAAVGLTFGAGDGGSTFNVPDLRRRTPVGAGGSGTATLGNAVGNSGGAETHVLTLAEMPAHTHQGFGAGITGTTLGAQYANNLVPLANQPVQATQAAGGNGAHNNVQPSLVLNFIIKT